MDSLVKMVLALDAVEQTDESTPIEIDGAKRITLMFTRSEHTAGNSVFAVDVSIDGSTYVTYNKLIDNATNTNVQNLTRVASKQLSADGSAILSMDLQHDHFRFMKVKVTETTDGKHTAKVLIEK